LAAIIRRKSAGEESPARQKRQIIAAVQVCYSFQQNNEIIYLKNYEEDSSLNFCISCC